MNVFAADRIHRFCLSTLCAAALGAAGVAHAENHALIMTIDYAGTSAALSPSGIEGDGKLAVAIAQGMGVAQQNTVWLRNGDLGRRGLATAIQDLVSNRIKDGDKVFLYYSGHGTQSPASSGSNKCTEGMVSADLKVFSDDELEAALDALTAKASQVVMLNDSCFAGGQASTKSRSTSAKDGAAKFYPAARKTSANDDGYVCGDEVNKSAFRNLGKSGKSKSSRLLYIAASSDMEVSRVLLDGQSSVATHGWARCLSDRSADSDQNGIIDGKELQRCSQAVIDKLPVTHQTITLQGEGGLPLSFTASSGSDGNANVGSLGQTLQSLQSAADPTIKVDISVRNPRLKIGKEIGKGEKLDFSVQSDRAGYLYLLHVATDGKFYQLFPNTIDTNNYVNAGTHRFPRATWAVEAQGPEGQGYVMAYLSSAPRDFSKQFSADGVFRSGDATASTARKLAVVALDGRFGASKVAVIEEVR